MAKKIRGVLFAYCETGTEGIMWSVYEDGKTGYAGLHCLSNGNHLKIFNVDGTVLFDDYIVIDRKIGWKPYHKNSKYGQPVALGARIHWTQKGWKPNDWAKLFIHDGAPFRAELIQPIKGIHFLEKKPKTPLKKSANKKR